MSKYHLCCNQLDSNWEIRDKFENVLFTGILKDMDALCENMNKPKHQKITFFISHYRITKINGIYSLFDRSSNIWDNISYLDTTRIEDVINTMNFIDQWY